MKTIIFILVIASFVQMLEMIMKKIISILLCICLILSTAALFSCKSEKKPEGPMAYVLAEKGNAYSLSLAENFKLAFEEKGGSVTMETFPAGTEGFSDYFSKSIDVEAWSPRQQKYFEVGSCSNLGDAQARRLKIRVKGESGTYLAHTLNNTVVAPPRMLIAFLENNLQADGSVLIPEALRPYMGGKEAITVKK